MMCAMNYYDYPENLNQKILKNVSDDSEHNFFSQLINNCHVNCFLMLDTVTSLVAVIRVQIFYQIILFQPQV